MPLASDYPAVLPRLKFTIRDLWAGRVSDKVRKQQEILSLALRDEA